MSANWPRWTAGAILLLWAGWWAFFAAAVIISEPWAGEAIKPIVLVMTLLSGALLAWRFPRPCAALLLLEGAFLLWAVFGYLHNPMPTTWFLFGTLALPPLLAGLLLFTPPTSQKPITP
jgi:hypothetical protein